MRPTVNIGARRRRSQGGFALTETSMAIVILSMVAAGTAWVDLDRSQDLNAIAQGQALKTASGGMTTYQTNYYTQLLNGTAVQGVADPYHPTAAELVALKLLPAGFRSTGFKAGTIKFALSKVDPACVPPACDIQSVSYLDSPITSMTGAVDYARIGLAAKNIGADAAYSTASAPGTLLSYGGGTPLPNPVGNVPGILAIRTGYGSSSMAQFLRRDSSLPPVNDFDVGGHSITNTQDIHASGTVTANAVTLPAGNSLTVGSAVVYGDQQNTALRQPGAVYFQGPGGVGTADLAQVGNINSTGTVTAPTMNLGTPSGACQRGQVSLVSNVGYICNQSGGWVNAGNLIGNVQTVQKYVAYHDTWGVAKPTCVGGSPTATIVPQTTGVNVTANPPWETALYKLNDQGTWWSVQISMKDPNGNWYSGENLGLTAEVDVQCQYANE